MNNDRGSEEIAATSNLVLWLAALALWLPAVIPYACHFRLSPSKELVELQYVLPTGFIQYDQLYYMINAAAHFDESGLHLFYGLPFSPDADSPRIYFQPHILVLGILWKITGLDPATVFLTFGMLSGLICIRIGLALFQELFGLRSLAQWLVAVLWIWGGGLFTLLGSVRYLWTKDLDDLFYFEPAGGMWFLNLGRNMIFPMEAYYHAIFLGAIYQTVRKRYWISLSLSLLLSMCHPFTGIELILILLGWACLERWWLRSDEIVEETSVDLNTGIPNDTCLVARPVVPMWWLAGLFMLAAAHMGYYFWFLRRFPEHRSLQEQWTQDWTYEIQHFALAYAFVGFLALWGLRNFAKAREFLNVDRNRLFLTWFLVAFALANHEFAIKPSIQPMHFTRGYVWMALFLLSAPTLVQWTLWLLSKGVWRWISVSSLAIFFLMDNFLFLTTFHFRDASLDNEIYIPESFNHTVKFLDKPEYSGSIVISPSPKLNYWLLLHCPVRAWYSHVFNTPYSAKRITELENFYMKGEFLPEWKDRVVIIIVPKNVVVEGNPQFGATFQALNIQWVDTNADYQIYRYAPQIIGR